MRCPSCVADANRTRHWFFAHLGVETGKLADRAGDLKPVAMMGHNSGAVIAAIFQTLQRIEQGIAAIFKTDRTDDSAHALSPYSNILSVRTIVMIG